MTFGYNGIVQGGPRAYLGSGTLPDVYSITDAESVLAAGNVGDVVNVMGSSSGKLVCQLRRQSGGNIANHVDFRNADAGTFVIGTSASDDIELSTSRTASFDATDGLSFDGAVIARLNFMGLWDPKEVQTQTQMTADATTTATDAVCGAGFIEVSTSGDEGLAGGIFYDGADWIASGFYDTMTGTGPTFSGTGTAVTASFPLEIQPWANAWHKDGETTSVVRGYCGVTGDTITAGFNNSLVNINGGGTAAYVGMLFYDPEGSDLTCSWRTFDAIARL